MTWFIALVGWHAKLPLNICLFCVFSCLVWFLSLLGVPVEIYFIPPALFVHFSIHFSQAPLNFLALLIPFRHFPSLRSTLHLTTYRPFIRKAHQHKLPAVAIIIAYQWIQPSALTGLTMSAFQSAVCVQFVCPFSNERKSPVIFHPTLLQHKVNRRERCD